MADFGPLYQAAGTQYGIDPLLLQTLAGKESDQDPDAVGPTITRGPAAGQHALGIMQFIPQTAAQYDVTYPMSPVQSVFGASNYMDTLLKKHDGNLRAALAEYSGNAGNQNAPYVNDVMGRYTALQRAWAASGPQPAGPAPATDTDPSSPTYGETTGKSFTTPPSVPAYGTTAKGNAGQPSASVPTTAAPNAPPGGIVMTAGNTFAPPSREGPKGQTQTPDYLGDAPPAQAKPTAVPAAPAGASAGPDYLEDAPPQVDAEGQPIKPVDTGQYLTAPTSPGATAVGTSGVTHMGTSIAEDRVPGPGFQAKINIATDPAQKARIAASTLFPNDPNALDRIIVGADGRMAAVDDGGQPYYIEPQRVISSDQGTTRGAPGTPWQPTDPLYSSPYGAPFREPVNLSPGNVVRAAAAAAPNALVTGLSYAPAAVGNPLVGSLLVGGATAATEAGRQRLANWLDPNNATAPSAFNENVARDAVQNALLNTGFRVGGALFRPAAMVPRGAAETAPIVPEPSPGLEAHPFATRTQFPGQQPWPVGPSTPIEGRRPDALIRGGAVAVPAEARTIAGVQLNPAGAAAAASGPYAASTPAEVAQIPETLPRLWTPVLTQSGAEARADQIIRHFAANGPIDADIRDLVPGSSGTLAQTTGNAGLATLERAVRNLPDATNVFNALDTAQQEARRNAVAGLAGTPQDLEQLTAARDAATAQARQAAFANTTPTDPSEAVAEIDRVLQGPDGKRPGISGPLQQLRSLFYSTDTATGAQTLDTDPEMLYGVRKAITDSLSPLARGTASDARTAAAQLQPVLAKLDAAIEAGAPGYSDYMKQFAALSKPIDAMEYLQGRNLTDANGYPTLQKVDATLKDIQKQRTLQAGVRPADALSDDQIAQLSDLRDDLRRQANLGKGKPLGSNTVQNLAGNTAINMLTRPAAYAVGRGVSGVLGGFPGYAAEQGAEAALGGLNTRGERMVRQALIDRLLNRNNLGLRALTVPLAGAPAAAPGALPTMLTAPTVGNALTAPRPPGSYAQPPWIPRAFTAAPPGP